MFTLYCIGGILVLVAAIWGLIKLSDHLETKYNYSMVDWTNLITLCITAVITLLIVLFVVIGHEAPQYQGGIFDINMNKTVLVFVNIAVLVFVFIRNMVKSSLLCSLIITPFQVIVAMVLLVALFIVLLMVEKMGRKLFERDRRKV